MSTTLLNDFLFAAILFNLLFGHIFITIEDALNITLTSDILNLPTTEIKR